MGLPTLIVNSVFLWPRHPNGIQQHIKTMPGNIHSPTAKLKEGTFVLDPHFLESCHTPHPWNFTQTRSGVNGGSRGRAQGVHPPRPPLTFRPKWGPKGRKIFFFELPPPPTPLNLRVWMTAPPPRPSVWRSGSATGAFNKHRRPTKHVGYFAHRRRLILPRKKKQLVWITL